MEDRIEIGEYVRTKNGIIDKVERFSVGCCLWHCENGMCIDECNCIGTHLEDIVKHSKIISEVVEAGDYVNGKLIHKIDKGPNYCYLYYGKGKTFVDYQIKTILTKEQYMSNCYKVGGEDESN